MDSSTTIKDLVGHIGSFIDERCWNPYHDPKNLSMSIAIEAAELMEIFQWQDSASSRAICQDSATIDRVRDEIADVIIYSLSLSRVLNIDVSSAILDKLERNKIRYPVDNNPWQDRRKMNQ
jgi:dCTP diphosphatase